MSAGDQLRDGHSEVTQEEPAKCLQGGGSPGKEQSFSFTRCVTAYSREPKREKIPS